MVLKKQTVWLITMLSLLIVLSVYYMLPGDDQVAMTDGEDDQNEEENSDDPTEGMDEDFVISELAAEDYFQTIRLETEDSRNEMKESLSEVISSASATSEEKNDAMNQIYSIETTTQKESLLEKMIIQEKEFEDVLVRQNDSNVSITVMSDELSKTDANHLMQMARDEFGVMNVSVKQQGDDNQEGEQPDSEHEEEQPDQEQQEDETDDSQEDEE